MPEASAEALYTPQHQVRRLLLLVTPLSVCPRENAALEQGHSIRACSA